MAIWLVSKAPLVLCVLAAPGNLRESFSSFHFSVRQIHLPQWQMQKTVRHYLTLRKGAKLLALHKRPFNAVKWRQLSVSTVSILPGYHSTLELVCSCFSRNCSIEQHNYQGLQSLLRDECLVHNSSTSNYIWESHSLKEQSLCKSPTHSFVPRK